VGKSGIHDNTLLKKIRIKEKIVAQRWWITTVILTTLETDTRRITIKSQARTNSFRDLTMKVPNTKQGW
jgi:CDP-diacylglycerol pyrophosphatase